MNRKTLIALLTCALLGVFTAATTAPAFADYSSGNGKKVGHSNGKGNKNGHAKQDARNADDDSGDNGDSNEDDNSVTINFVF